MLLHVWDIDMSHSASSKMMLTSLINGSTYLIGKKKIPNSLDLPIFKRWPWNFLYKMEKSWVPVGQIPEVQRSPSFWLALYPEYQPQCRTYYKFELLRSLKRNYFQVIFENLWGLKKKWHKLLCHLRCCSQSLYICFPAGLASQFPKQFELTFCKSVFKKIFCRVLWDTIKINDTFAFLPY